MIIYEKIHSLFFSRHGNFQNSNKFETNDQFKLIFFLKKALLI